MQCIRPRILQIRQFLLLFDLDLRSRRYLCVNVERVLLQLVQIRFNVAITLDQIRHMFLQLLYLFIGRFGRFS